jgi:hypothetical protein
MIPDGRNRRLFRGSPIDPQEQAFPMDDPRVHRMDGGSLSSSASSLTNERSFVTRYVESPSSECGTSMESSHNGNDVEENSFGDESSSDLQGSGGSDSEIFERRDMSGYLEPRPGLQDSTTEEESIASASAEEGERSFEERIGIVMQQDAMKTEEERRERLNDRRMRKKALGRRIREAINLLIETVFLGVIVGFIVCDDHLKNLLQSGRSYASPFASFASGSLLSYIRQFNLQESRPGLRDAARALLASKESSDFLSVISASVVLSLCVSYFTIRDGMTAETTLFVSLVATLACALGYGRFNILSNVDNFAVGFVVYQSLHIFVHSYKLLRERKTERLLRANTLFRAAIAASVMLILVLLYVARNLGPLRYPLLFYLISGCLALLLDLLGAYEGDGGAVERLMLLLMYISFSVAIYYLLPLLVPRLLLLYSSYIGVAFFGALASILSTFLASLLSSISQAFACKRLAGLSYALGPLTVCAISSFSHLVLLEKAKYSEAESISS